MNLICEICGYIMKTKKEIERGTHDFCFQEKLSNPLKTDKEITELYLKYSKTSKERLKEKISRLQQLAPTGKLVEHSAQVFREIEKESKSKKTFKELKK